MELMVVLAVIFILLAVAIPGMREMMIPANEASATASIRAINTAEAAYQATYGGYAESLGQLEGTEPVRNQRKRLACWIRGWLAKRSRGTGL